MAENKPPRNNVHCTLPDDPEQSTYRFIIVAAKRARQLQGGARPVLPTSSKKPTIIAMEEVRRGLVKYDLTGPLANGHHDQVVMTAAAEEFVRPLTFAALTGRKVLTNLFAVESAIEHIAVAQEHELLVIAPATADLMAKLAHGLADDFLTTLYLAFTGPVLLAPAMNVNMWQHPATQANLATLVKRGHTIVEPGSGYLACGMSGPGRLADPEIIAAAGERAAHPRRDLEGETVLITAGPTQEPLDPVRYISNRSSGKMGYALAEAAAARGARVILISGPVHLAAPEGVELIQVQTAAEMYHAVMGRLD